MSSAILRNGSIISGLLLVLSLLGSCSKRDLPVKKPPMPPIGLRTSSSPQGVEAKWNAIPGVTHYTLFWGREKGDYSNLTDAFESHGVINGLTQGEVYHISVTAWNNHGESDYATPVSIVYEFSPENAPRLSARGDSLMKQGRLEDAETYYSAAIRLSPLTPEAYRKRGELYRRMSKIDLARRDTENAVRVADGKSPQDPALKMADAPPEMK